MADEVNYSQYYDPNLKLKDLEEKQNIIKDRLLLIGQNLIETKESTNEKIVDMKKDIEMMKNELERIKDFIETISGELGKFAKKEDLEILSKQAKMFQPLEFVRKSDLVKLRREA
jgi:hypothetical protein